jgi:DNA-binding transcriptional regulator YdaS (Cro superfamily)
VTAALDTVARVARGPQKRRVDPAKEVERAAAHAFLVEVMKEFDDVGLHVARKLGVSPSLISEAFAKRKPVGPELARALARYRNVLVDEVYGRARPQTIYKPDRYPNLEKAIEREAAAIPEAVRVDTLSRCRSIAMNFPSDRSVGEWIDELHAVARSVRRAMKTGDALTGRPYDEDDTPPGES